jgi:hypothetical protein
VQFKAREVKKALTGKGFKEENRDHHYYFLYYLGKKSPINTKISFGETDLDPRLSSFMARQIKLTSPKFKDFVDCKLTEEKYVELLIQSGHIVPQPSPAKNKSSR